MDKNNKGRRILALAGIIILAALYITTLVLAIIGTADTTPWFMACICATIIVPIILWIYTWLYKFLKKEVSDSINNDDESR
ncbi:MAG: hypothetical protein HUJ76_06120 [Parasporobacterium sp.]|nr:hypothetical protein [Parasporobacterium sp.]